MKVYFGLLFLALFAGAMALTDEQKEKFQGYVKDCMTSTSVDKTHVEKMRAGEFNDDPKLKEYVHCMFKKLNFINDDGVLQADVIKSKIPSDVNHDEALKVIDACKDTKAPKPEETAYEAYKCYRKNTKVLITV